MSVDVEVEIEQGLKTDLIAAFLAAETADPFYRFAWLDDTAAADDPDTVQDERVEEVEHFPVIAVKANPYVPLHANSSIYECMIEVIGLTINGPEDDPTGADLRALYKIARPALEGDLILNGLRHNATVVEDSLMDIGAPEDDTNVLGLSLLISVQVL